MCAVGNLGYITFLKDGFPQQPFFFLCAQSACSVFGKWPLSLFLNSRAGKGETMKMRLAVFALLVLLNSIEIYGFPQSSKIDLSSILGK